MNLVLENSTNQCFLLRWWLSQPVQRQPLPVTMKQVESELGVHEDISGFVLPLGVTINMDGTRKLYAQAVATVLLPRYLV